MDIKNGKVLVSKRDCRALRLVMGCSTDLRVKLNASYINYSYVEAGEVVKIMIENHLWFGCPVDELNNILTDRVLLWNIAERMLKGEYDYE